VPGTLETDLAMNVDLTPQLEELVRQKVASGLYTSATEVIQEALRLLEEQDRLRNFKLESLRRDIEVGLNSGPAASWDAEESKRESRKRRDAGAGGSRT
jgi:antitoxin ParD1/3/4